MYTAVSDRSKREACKNKNISYSVSCSGNLQVSYFNYHIQSQAFQQLLGRELEPWETILVGALSGGLAAVATTPFDVMKTRTMTAPQGRPISMSLVAVSILRHEGPLGLFKGAVPRFFWIAPLGAMNFAGYELAKKAMDKTEEQNISNG